jgi:hypothetical protein
MMILGGIIVTLGLAGLWLRERELRRNAEDRLQTLGELHRLQREYWRPDECSGSVADSDRGVAGGK